MDELFRQLGDLFLGSIPTMVIFLVLLFCYTALVHRPLGRVLAERRERTVGVVERAHAANAEAERRTQEYERQLQSARVEILAGRERQIAGLNAERDRAIAESRQAADAELRKVRAAIEETAKQTRTSMEPAIDELAGQIVARVAAPAPRGRDGR